MSSFGDFFTTLSMTASPTDFNPLFGDNGLSGELIGYKTTMSLSADATQIVEFVRYSLGEPVVMVELSNEQIFTAFEWANLTYSSIVNTYQARSWFASLLGMKVNYNQNDLVNKLPQPSLDALMKLAEPYSHQSSPYAGSKSLPVTRCFLQLDPGRATYDIYREGRVMPNNVYEGGADENYPTILDHIQSTSASKADIKKVHYYRDSVYGRFIDPYSAFMWLENFQAGYRNQVEAMHVMPIWGDVLRMQMLSTSDQVRRSEMKYDFNANKITFYPSPRTGLRIYFETAFIGSDSVYKEPWEHSLTGNELESSLTSVNQYVTGLHNVPFADITYAEVNPMGKNWIRDFTLGVCMETLGRVRSKYNAIDIPGQGSMTLDGDRLISDGKEKQNQLKENLEKHLEEMSQEKVIEKEAKKAQDLNTQLKFIPSGIYRV
jgi:hypothetical protein